MGSRKKSKTSHASTPNDSPAASKASLPLPVEPNDSSHSVDSNAISDTLNPPPAPTAAVDIVGRVNNRKSWYGSWTQKSPAVSIVETENVTAERGPSAIKDSEPKEENEPLDTTKSPTRYLSDTSRRSFRGTPLETSTTKLTIKSTNGNAGEFQQAEQASQDEAEQPSEPPLPPDPPKSEASDDNAGAPGSQTTGQPPTGWFGWWSRPDGYVEGISRDSTLVDEAQKTPLPGVTPSEDIPNPIPEPLKSSELALASADVSLDVSDKEAEFMDGISSRSWFWRWSRAQNARSDQASKPEDKPSDNSTADTTSAPKQASVPSAIPARIAEDQEPKPASIKEDKAGSGASTPRLSLQRKKSSGWAFWSKEPPSPGPSPGIEGSVHKLVGELAVADTPSQSRPEAAQFNEQEQSSKQATTQARTDPGLSVKNPKDEKAHSKAPLAIKTNAALNEALKVPEPPLTPSKQPAKQVAKEPQKPNLLMPDFKSTYSLTNDASLWKQIRGYFLASENDQPRLRLLASPPRVKKAMAIGVHGFFPSPIVQKVLGAPTGTSIKFANAGAAAIKQWTEDRGYECEIEKVALEGEGVITDRVDTLWKLLLNWADHIRQADFVLVGCHSQGVPVAIMLVAKLIESGSISATRIGICAMAGVNLGPFMDFKTRLWGGSTLELFDFCNPKSKVSQMYQSALSTVLRHGVRVTYVGSIDDQLVSMEVSQLSPQLRN